MIVKGFIYLMMVNDFWWLLMIIDDFRWLMIVNDFWLKCWCVSFWTTWEKKSNDWKLLYRWLYIRKTKIPHYLKPYIFSKHFFKHPNLFPSGLRYTTYIFWDWYIWTVNTFKKLLEKFFLYGQLPMVSGYQCPT